MEGLITGDGLWENYYDNCSEDEDDED